MKMMSAMIVLLVAAMLNACAGGGQPMGGPPLCSIDGVPSWNKSACALAEKAHREREEALRAEERRDRERRDHQDRMEALDRHTEENRKRREAVDALEGRKDSLNVPPIPDSECFNGKIGYGGYPNYEGHAAFCRDRLGWTRRGEHHFWRLQRGYISYEDYKALRICDKWDEQCERRQRQRLGVPG